MSRQSIQTERAPRAIGPYSQAVVHGDTVYLSGQIPLDPISMQLVGGEDIVQQTRRVFDNLQAVAEAAGGGMDRILRLCIYLTDLGEFAKVNDTMAKYFEPPYPARVTIGVAALPKGARIEIDAVMARPPA